MMKTQHRRCTWTEIMRRVLMVYELTQRNDSVGGKHNLDLLIADREIKGGWNGKFIFHVIPFMR